MYFSLNTEVIVAEQVAENSALCFIFLESVCMEQKKKWTKIFEANPKEVVVSKKVEPNVIYDLFPLFLTSQYNQVKIVFMLLDNFSAVGLSLITVKVNKFWVITRNKRDHSLWKNNFSFVFKGRQTFWLAQLQYFLWRGFKESNLWHG